MVSSIRSLLVEGWPLDEAISESALTRLGPVLMSAPKEVWVEFSEELEIALSTAKIEGPDGKTVEIGGLLTDKRNVSLIISIKGKLKPGAYTVSWNIAAEEHDMPGGYRFEVKPEPPRPRPARRGRRSCQRSSSRSLS